MSGIEPESDFIFTFGMGQPHAGRFVRIHGTFNSAREEMFRRHGPVWCGQYVSEDDAGVARWGYTELLPPRLDGVNPTP